MVSLRDVAKLLHFQPFVTLCCIVVVVAVVVVVVVVDVLAATELA